MFREHKEIWYRVNPIHAVYSAGRLAHDSVKFAFLPHLVVGANAKVPEWDTHRELVVMVVGETARADHFSLNGYERKTNPRLQNEDVINFPDFWSCGTSTAQSVPCIFSHYSRAEFDTEKASAADNALDILKRAGVSILWRDNNSSSKHVADRVEYEVYLTNKTNPVCDVECRDEGMLSGLQDYIDRHLTGDVLIVLHQMGNHGPAYYKRYPPAFEKFTPACKTSDPAEMPAPTTKSEQRTMNRKRVRARFIVNLTGSRRQNGAFYADKMVALLICRKNAGAIASSLEKRGFSATPLEITLGERTIARSANS